MLIEANLHPSPSMEPENLDIESIMSDRRHAVEESIREVIAFPKNNRGVDLMTHSPVSIDFKQLRELYIQSTAKKA